MCGQQELSHSLKPHSSQVKPQAATTQGNGLYRLSRASSSSQPACTRRSAVPDKPDHSVASRLRGNSIGPSNFNRWRHQKPIEESWTPITRASSSRRASKNDIVITDALHHLQIAESEPQIHGAAKSKTGGGGGGGGGVDPNSSIKTSHRGSNVPNARKNDRITYADAARGPSAPRVKHGQLAFGKDAIPYFACFCCKRRALSTRASGRPIPPTVQLCQCVLGERPVRRSLPVRHIVPNPRRDCGEISQLQHDELKGPAYKRARDAAKDLGLEGRARDVFLWREGFVTLHRAYARVKDLLDPFAYFDDRLDPQTIRQIEAELQPTPRPPNPVIDSPSLSYAQVVAGMGNQPSTVGARPFPRDTSRAHNTVQDASQRGQYMERPQYAAPIFTRHDPHPQHQVPEQPRQPHPADPADRHGAVLQHQFTRPFTELLRPPRPPHANSRHGPAVPPSTRRESWQSVPPQTPPSRHDVPIGRPNQQGMSEFTFLPGAAQSHQAQTADWETPRLPGHPQYPISFQGTGQRTRSSQMQSTPSWTYGTESTNTGHTLYFAPGTPTDPETPTPYFRHADSVINDLRFPPGTIDPKVLEKIPEQIEMTSELEGQSRSLKRARDKHDDRGR